MRNKKNIAFDNKINRDFKSNVSCLSNSKEKYFETSLRYNTNKNKSDIFNMKNQSTKNIKHNSSLKLNV